MPTNPTPGPTNNPTTNPPPLDPYGHVLYLDFSGAPITYGAPDGPNGAANISANQIATTIPPFMHDKVATTRGEAIDYLTEQVRALYSPFDVQVVNRRPAIANYTRLLVGGERLRDADYDRPDAVGVTTSTACGANDISERGIGFVFTATIFNDPTSYAKDVTITMAHEAAHMYGLNHSDSTSSLMHFDTNTSSTWGVGTVTSDSSAICGRVTQDDEAVLTANLGVHRSDRSPVPLVDDTPPEITSVSPVDGTTIAYGGAPCLTASSAAGVRMAMLEIYKAQATLPPSLGKRIHVEAKMAPPFVFAPYGALADGIVYRFTVLDNNGNLTETRSKVNIKASGTAPPPCL